MQYRQIAFIAYDKSLQVLKKASVEESVVGYTISNKIWYINYIEILNPIAILLL